MLRDIFMTRVGLNAMRGILSTDFTDFPAVAKAMAGRQQIV
jgi:hypothetical protein